MPKVSENAREESWPGGQCACGKSDSRRVNEKQTQSTGSCSAKKICTVQGFLWYPAKTCYNLASFSLTPGKMVWILIPGYVASAAAGTGVTPVMIPCLGTRSPELFVQIPAGNPGAAFGCGL